MSKSKHQPTYEETKAEFEIALAKAKKISGNKDTVIKVPSYVMRGGIPHKLVEGRWVPLTRIN